MTQKPMVVLTGPTAVGKTALSIELAKKINGAIMYFTNKYGDAKVSTGL